MKDQLFSYRLAGQTLFTNQRLTELQPFASTEPIVIPEFDPRLAQISKQDPPSITEYGYLGDLSVQVSIWKDLKGYVLEIQGLGCYWVAPDGRILFQLVDLPQMNEALLTQALLGPPLALALALSGVWCLHASAAIYQDKLLAFTGESGKGKSTLAEYLGNRRERGFKLVADDVLPVQWEQGRLYAWPRFPQLKLPPGEQPSLDLPEKIPLSAIYNLDELPDEAETIAIQRVGKPAAALLLIHHTIAARLFDPGLLTCHLDFTLQAASAIPVQRLLFPRDYDLLPAVEVKIMDDLAGFAQSIG